MDNSIAILPFINRSADPEHEYFSDGLTEEIINALTTVSGLKVIARTSSFLFKGKEIDIKRIGEQLQVNTILKGSIDFVGAAMRIRTQLIEVESGFNIWSATFDRSFDAVFAIQDEISLLIADKLREYIGHLDIADQLVGHPGVGFHTYQAYWRAKYYLQKFNKPDVERGMQILHTLSEEYPDFVPPYLSLNYAYTYLAALGIMPAEEAFSKAQYFLDKAVAIDKDSPECQLRMAGVSLWQDWDLEAAYKHLNATLDKQPGNAEAHLWLGVCLAVGKRFKAAHHYMDKALALDPFSPLFHDFKGVVYYFEGNYEAATQAFQRCLSLDPNFLMSHVNLAATELITGQLEKGLKRFQNLPASGDADLSRIGGTTLAYAMLGEMEKVDSGITQLETALESDVMGRALFFLVIIHIQLKEYEKALDWLAIGITNKITIFITLPIEPFFQPLTSFPRFQKMLKAILPEMAPLQIQKEKPSTIEEEQLTTDFEQLETFMQKESPYLEASLNLRGLAKMLDWHPNYLSRLINDRAKKNFSEYINTYRLTTFKTKANDPANGHLTILALAYESGFSSKTVFNTFFKKITGMTPKQYWKEQQA
jgi:adenylate cyclase